MGIEGRSLEERGNTYFIYWEVGEGKGVLYHLYCTFQERNKDSGLDFGFRVSLLARLWMRTHFTFVYKESVSEVMRGELRYFESWRCEHCSLAGAAKRYFREEEEDEYCGRSGSWTGLGGGGMNGFVFRWVGSRSISWRDGLNSKFSCRLVPGEGSSVRMVNK